MGCTCSQRLHAGYIAMEPELSIMEKINLIEGVTGHAVRAHTVLMTKVVVFDILNSNGNPIYTLTSRRID